MTDPIPGYAYPSQKSRESIAQYQGNSFHDCLSLTIHGRNNASQQNEIPLLDDYYHLTMIWQRCPFTGVFNSRESQEQWL
jgi:hypothetical protein